MAQNIGTDSVPVDANHPSIKTIVQYKSPDFNFDFKPVSENFISKQIDKLKIKKATDIDSIPAKVLKLGKPALVKPLTKLVNNSFTTCTSTFPSELKTARVTSLHKKNSTLVKGNYRPVSILPVLSKIS